MLGLYRPSEPDSVISITLGKLFSDPYRFVKGFFNVDL